MRIVRHVRVDLAALATSVFMILLGQANAWYANQPESNIVKDIKRKISIAILDSIKTLVISIGILFLHICTFIFSMFPPLLFDIVSYFQYCSTYKFTLF